MAENKKSFILYAGIASMVEKLPDEIAGRLFKIILDYVNDKNPVVDDLLLQIAFDPIKQQLKRDLKEWEDACKQHSESGRKGGLKSGENRSSLKQRQAPLQKPKQDEAKVSTASKIEANEADNDSENDIDTDIEKEREHARTNKIFLENSNLNRKPYIPTIEIVYENFARNGGTEEQARSFFNKHDSVGWFLNGSPIINFVSLIGSFITNWEKNEQRSSTNNGKQPKLGTSAARTEALKRF